MFRSSYDSNHTTTPIRQTIKSSLKLSKHSQVQPLHYSASAFQNSYNSTVKLRSTVFLGIFYIPMLITCVTTLRNFLHFNVKDMRPVSSNSSFPCKFRFWETKILNNLLMKVFKKKNRCHSISAQKNYYISYYTKFSRIIFFFCTFFLISSNIFYHNFKLYFMREKFAAMNFLSSILQNLG